MRCTNCRFRLRARENHCPNCGTEAPPLRTRRNVLLALAIIFLLAGGLALTVQLHATLPGDALLEPAQGFLTAMGEARYDEALGWTSAGFRESVSEEQLAALAGQLPDLSALSGLEKKNVRLGRLTADLLCYAHLREVGPVPMTFLLHHEGGSWRVASFQCPTYGFDP